MTQSLWSCFWQKHIHIRAILIKIRRPSYYRSTFPQMQIANTFDQEKAVDDVRIPPHLIRFTTHFDAENPQDWPLSRKWTVTGVLSATGFNRIMVSTIMAPALPVIARELHISNIESVMSMSVYLLATAVGPLLIGPLSEVYGPSPVLHVTNIWFLIWNLVCGFADSTGVLITARLMAGFGASAIYTSGQVSWEMYGRMSSGDDLWACISSSLWLELQLVRFWEALLYSIAHGVGCSGRHRFSKRS